MVGQFAAKFTKVPVAPRCGLPTPNPETFSILCVGQPEGGELPLIFAAPPHSPNISQ